MADGLCCISDPLRLEANGELVLWNAKKNARDFATNHPSTRRSDYVSYQLVQQSDTGYIAVYGNNYYEGSNSGKGHLVSCHEDLWHTHNAKQGCRIIVDGYDQLIIQSADGQMLEGIWPRN